MILINWEIYYLSSCSSFLVPSANIFYAIILLLSVVAGILTSVSLVYGNFDYQAFISLLATTTQEAREFVLRFLFSIFFRIFQFRFWRFTHLFYPKSCNLNHGKNCRFNIHDNFSFLYQPNKFTTSGQHRQRFHSNYWVKCSERLFQPLWPSGSEHSDRVPGITVVNGQFSGGTYTVVFLTTCAPSETSATRNHGTTTI